MCSIIQTLYANLLKPKSFASWAKPKAEDLNVPRKRYLNDNNEVVWNIGTEKNAAQIILKCPAFIPNLF